MAFDLNNNFFTRLDARNRILMLVASVVGLTLLIYFGTKYFMGGDATTGATRLASAPQSLQSVPGGANLTPEYARAVREANAQAATQAIKTGTSSIPTTLNPGGSDFGSQQGQCNIICTDQSANVKYDLDKWVSEGKVTPEVATELKKLAEANVPVSEYAARLSQLVKAGKLTPEQARLLLDQYKKQHANNLLQDSAKMMDDLIKSGQLPVDAANELLQAQKDGATPQEYAALLDKMVKDGRISPAVAQQLMAQYNKQHADEAAKENVASIAEMAASGEISPEIAKQLTDLTNSGASVADYAAALQKAVAAGKLTPAAAAKLLDAYTKQKLGIGPSAALDSIVKKAQEQLASAIAAPVNNQLDALVATGKMTKEAANQLKNMAASGATPDEYAAAVNELVREGKISPEEAKGLIDKYQTQQALKQLAASNMTPEQYAAAVADLVKQGKLTPDEGQRILAGYKAAQNAKEEAARLAALQANNASAADYANELKQAVQAGMLTPDQAAQMMQQYQAVLAANTPGLPPGGASVATGPGSDAFAKLQERVQQAGATGDTAPTGAVDTGALSAQFAADQVQAQQQMDADKQARIQAMMTAMSGQAQQLVAAWQQPIQMVHKAGMPPSTTSDADKLNGKSSSSSSSTTTSTTTATAPAIIKAGEVAFAVLDTAVNSDYPNTPVMATIVQGRLKGAKLMGTLQTTPNVAGQMDKVSLTFTLMNLDVWPASKAVTAYAIDPDTARTVFASNVDYHYMMKFGAMMATSFMQGYASAIMNSSSTSTTGIFGTSTTRPEFSPSQKIATALGQMGQTVGTATQAYSTIPPTVKVDSGVGLGILFMADVT